MGRSVAAVAILMVVLVRMGSGHVIRREARLDRESPNAHNDLESDWEEEGRELEAARQREELSQELKDTYARKHFINNDFNEVVDAITLGKSLAKKFDGAPHETNSEERDQAYETEDDLKEDNDEEETENDKHEDVSKQDRIVEENQDYTPLDDIEEQEDGNIMEEENRADEDENKGVPLHVKKLPENKTNNYVDEDDEKIVNEQKVKSKNAQKEITSVNIPLDEMEAVEDGNNGEEERGEEDKIKESQQNLSGGKENYDMSRDKAEELEQEKNVEENNNNEINITQEIANMEGKPVDEMKQSKRDEEKGEVEELKGAEQEDIGDAQDTEDSLKVQEDEENMEGQIEQKEKRGAEQDVKSFENQVEGHAKNYTIDQSQQKDNINGEMENDEDINEQYKIDDSEEQSVDNEEPTLSHILDNPQEQVEFDADKKNDKESAIDSGKETKVERELVGNTAKINDNNQENIINDTQKEQTKHRKHEAYAKHSTHNDNSVEKKNAEKHATKSKHVSKRINVEETANNNEYETVNNVRDIANENETGGSHEEKNHHEVATTHETIPSNSEEVEVDHSVKNTNPENEKNSEKLMKHKHKKYEEEKKKHSNSKEEDAISINEQTEKSKDGMRDEDERENKKETETLLTKYTNIKEENTKNPAIPNEHNEDLHNSNNSFEHLKENQDHEQVEASNKHSKHNLDNELPNEGKEMSHIAEAVLSNNDESVHFELPSNNEAIDVDLPNNDEDVEQFEFFAVVPDLIDTEQNLSNKSSSIERDSLEERFNEDMPTETGNLGILRAKGEITINEKPEVDEVDVIEVTKMNGEDDEEAQPSTIVEIVEIVHAETNDSDEDNDNGNKTNLDSSSESNESFSDTVVDAIRLINIENSEEIDGTQKGNKAELEKVSAISDILMPHDFLEELGISNPLNDVVDVLNLDGNSTQGNATGNQTGIGSDAGDTIPLAFIEFPRAFMEVVDLSDTDNNATDGGNATHNGSTLEVTSYEDVVLFPDGIMEILETPETDDDILKFYNFKENEEDIESAKKNKDLESPYNKTYIAPDRVEISIDKENTTGSALESDVADNKSNSIKEVLKSVEKIIENEKPIQSTIELNSTAEKTKDLIEVEKTLENIKVNKNPAENATDFDSTDNKTRELIGVPKVTENNNDTKLNVMYDNKLGDVKAESNVMGNTTDMENPAENVTKLDGKEDNNNKTYVPEATKQVGNTTDNGKTTETVVQLGITGNHDIKQGMPNSGTTHNETLSNSLDGIEDSYVQASNEQKTRKKRQPNEIYTFVNDYASGPNRPNENEYENNNMANIGANTNKNAIIVIAHSIKNITVGENNQNNEMEKNMLWRSNATQGTEITVGNNEEEKETNIKLEDNLNGLVNENYDHEKSELEKSEVPDQDELINLVGSQKASTNETYQSKASETHNTNATLEMNTPTSDNKKGFEDLTHDIAEGGHGKEPGQDTEEKHMTENKLEPKTHGSLNKNDLGVNLKGTEPIENQLENNDLDFGENRDNNKSELKHSDMIDEVAEHKFESRDSMGFTKNDNITKDEAAGDAVNKVEQPASELVYDTSSSAENTTGDSTAVPDAHLTRVERSASYSSPWTSAIYRAGSVGYPQLIEMPLSSNAQGNRYPIFGDHFNSKSSWQPGKKVKRSQLQWNNHPNNYGQVNMDKKLQLQSSQLVPQVLNPYSRPNNPLGHLPQLPDDTTFVIVAPQNSIDDFPSPRYPVPPPILPQYPPQPILAIPLMQIYPAPYPNNRLL